MFYTAHATLFRDTTYSFSSFLPGRCRKCFESASQVIKCKSSNGAEKALNISRESLKNEETLHCLKLPTLKCMDKGL